jgi:hypothetical protein
MVVSKSINWDNQVWIWAVDAVAEMNGYQATISDPNFVPTEEVQIAPQIPNPQSKIQFFNSWLKKKAINEITERDNRLALASVVPVVDTEV